MPTLDTLTAQNVALMSILFGVAATLPAGAQYENVIEGECRVIESDVTA